ncbi:acylphosphatase [Arenibaculum sp.]|jgi:acylphosphatase|uniref:acylphosphatase n=1 Tax=Arenibaculum sp. TaxID=2865862 RepID=UPI002E0EB4D8|nr:acylphosphatase [Arenibaculum sp.]
MTAMERKAVRVVVSGKVQGVWFRGWTVDQARARGLSGWVRNRADGTVEAVFAGDPAAVDAMVVACREGPCLARVDTIDVEPAADPGDSFEQRATL